MRLRLAGVEVEFVDRGVALGQIGELAERGTYPVYVVYGPEGCGGPPCSGGSSSC